MKKLVFLLLCLFSVQAMVWADTDKPIQIGQLPTKAQSFIAAYFKGHKVALAKVEAGLFSRMYDVIFTNGDKLEFDKAGDWTEVKCPSEGVPEGVIPGPIRDFLKKNNFGTKVLEIERDRGGYEIKLPNKWEVKFDERFQVVDIDD